MHAPSWHPAFSLFLISTALSLSACSRDGGGRDMRTTTTTHEMSVAGLVKTRSETTTTEPAAPADVEPEQQLIAPQAGLLTAADNDDLLNPDFYARYAGRFLKSHPGKLPFVDTRRRVAIKVVDSAGRGVPFARLDVQRPGTPLHLVAAADGTASLYPAFDRLPSRTDITVASAAGSAKRSIDVARSRFVQLPLSGHSAAASAMDLVLVIDATGSMGDEMTYLQSELESILGRLKAESGNLDLRVGIIVYRDEGDDYVVRSAPLTGDLASISSMLAEQQAAGGGDAPEAVDKAMSAAERMQWRTDAAKALLLVADAPPHEDAIPATLTAAEKLRSRGVQIVPVAASGVEENAEYVMRTMAALTQGRYIFLTDDSGIGNPHAEPDVACYVVTRLDQLIGRVLAGIAEGRRIEPSKAEIIRTVGHYDRGRCVGSGDTNQS
jgi:Mg-chelatase subunit ChlD